MQPKQKINKINKINWEEQFKIRPRRNASLKHETIKLYLVLNLLEKYKSKLHWIRIYTEHPLENGKICDVYFENIKTNEIIAYEIQKNISDKWLKETTEFYNKFERVFFKTDWILIKENDFNDNCYDIFDLIKDRYTM